MIYIFDLIGAKSGCMYYDDAFCKLLRDNNIQSVVVSNYSDSFSKKWLCNMYKGHSIVKLIKLCYNYCVLICLLLFRKTVIYLSYGTKVDCHFSKVGSHFKNFIVDVHEYVLLGDNDKDGAIKSKFDIIYTRVQNCIYHAERTRGFLEKVRDLNTCLFVPHFKYEFDKSYDLTIIQEEIKNAIDKNKINFLFFGHFRESKGICTLINAIKLEQTEGGDKCHFIFAGADPHKEFEKELCDLKKNHSVSVICRFIETEELNFLFDNVNVVILPYFEVSQSGVLETAVFFKKYLILSNIPYFKDFISRFPSFGCLFEKGNADDLRNKIFQSENNQIKSYNTDEIELFYQKNEFDTFVNQLIKII